MSESIRGQLLPPLERRGWLGHRISELLVQLAIIWVLIFGLLTVLLSFAVSAPYGRLSIAVDAARYATLVDVAIVILLKLLPEKSLDPDFPAGDQS
jgi:hypothetical protein